VSRLRGRRKHVGLIRNPLEGMVWFPGGTFKQSHWINRLHEMVLHELPAHLTDLTYRLASFLERPRARRG
jgi:hypothetical protein